MQDNAPCHKAVRTMVELDRLGIYLIPWPAFSPDLNPIESLWNSMKDYISVKCQEDRGNENGHGQKRRVSLGRLTEISHDVWEKIEIDELNQLMESMARRCQAVIDADGGYTRY